MDMGGSGPVGPDTLSYSRESPAGPRRPAPLEWKDGRWRLAEPKDRTDEEWRTLLSKEQYQVLRQKGTERAFTGKYWENHEDGTYLCAGCGEELFRSDDKFDSGSGWPSFTAPAAPGHVAEELDTTHGMTRTEVVCARCGGHLGHVFTDGPGPKGLRYCINSASLDFTPKKA
jgi:peptide-methionine (R)-S-oxide reductase